MFLKLLKYDFMFSAKTFSALGGIAFGVVIIIALTHRVSDGGGVESLLIGISSLLAVGLGIACIAEIFRFYIRSFFTKAGYLTFTMPVGRGKQLLSKIVVSLVWFLLAFVATGVALAIFALIATGIQLSDVADIFTITLFVNIIEITQIAIFAICLLFACITLANSVLANRRVHGIISGFLGFGVTFLFSWMQGALAGRFWDIQHFTQNINGHPSSWRGYRPLVGWQYGRIPLESYRPLSVFIDIFSLGATLAVCAALVALTYYLLKKRISLR